MDTIVQDVWYALRQFARRPGFAAIAVLSLGLAIGANSLIYGLVQGFVLRPFPYPDSDRLVAVGVGFPRVSDDRRYVEVLSPAEYADIKSLRSFGPVAAFDLGNRNISGGDVPERVFTALLLDDLFPVIGMAPQLGRGFTREELVPGGAPVAIISNRLWHTRFGGDPGIVGRSVRISSQSTTVVGVMPPGLLLIGTDLWMPWGGNVDAVPRNRRQFTVVARLRPGASLAAANAELATLAGRTDQSHRSQFKEYEGWSLTAAPWAVALLEDMRPAAFLLLGAVALVLLIACANLAHLFLARSTTRQRELAVRLALGAGRWRLARHVLTETVLVALAGGAAGVALAAAGMRGATALLPAQLQMLDLHAAIDTRVLLWSLGLTVATGVLIGIVPAFQATRTDPHESLKVDGRGGLGRGGARLRNVLVVAEVALSVVLLLGAGLLMRTFINIQRVDPGFEPRGVLTMRLTLPRDRYPGEAGNVFFDALLERLTALPQVRAASASSQYPPMAAFDIQVKVERPQGANEAAIPTALITVTTPQYFEALRVPMRSGRSFGATDSLNAPPVAIVNQAFVDRYLGGGEADRPANRAGQPRSSTSLDDDRRRGRRSPERRRHPIRSPGGLHAGPPADRLEPAVPHGAAPTATPRPCSRRCAMPSSRSTRNSRSISCARSRRPSPKRRSSRAWRRCSSRSSRPWPWCWPRSGSSACCPTPSAPAPRRSAFAWRWAPSLVMSAGWWSARSWS